jgi:acyl-CoA synthetase (AMP-forming)/AMP-acid ligase II
VIGDRRVNLDEVTTAVHRIRGVAGAVVLALPGDDGGVLAALVQVDDPEMTEERLARAMSGLLPVHQVPTVIRLTGRLPYTAEGRVDRVAAGAVLTGEADDRPAETDAVEPVGGGADAALPPLAPMATRPDNFSQDS